MDQLSQSNTKKEDLDLIGLCADIRKIATKNNFNAPLTELQDIVDKLKSQTIYIVILGLFKRGKSSIINAILDADIAPVAITPLTSVIIFFKFGESKKAEVFFEDGTSKKAEIHGIEEFVSEDLNPEIIKQTKEVLGKLMEKYDIKPHVAKLSEVIKSLKASNWVDLLDTDTKSLKRYGDFSDEESSKDLDHEIKKILRLTEKLIGR